MQPSQKILLVSLAIFGLPAGLALAHFFPNGHWAMPWVGGFLVASVVYTKLLEITANERQVNRDITKPKD